MTGQATARVEFFSWLWYYYGFSIGTTSKDKIFF
jgi:hypothetical protein